MTGPSAGPSSDDVEPVASVSAHTVAVPSQIKSVAHVVVEDPATALVPDDDYHHLSRVLRVRPGELVTLTDGKGRWVLASVPASWSKSTDPLELRSSLKQVGRPADVGVAISLVKSDKPDLVVQKLTELGVARITLIAADHSVVRWDLGKRDRQLERLGAIARAALMQSKGVWMPAIAGPLGTRDAVAEERTHGRLVAAANFDGPSLRSGFAGTTGHTVFVGPEGGWSQQERALFGSNVVSLGPTVLRAETAAIVVGALLVSSAWSKLSETTDRSR